MAAHRGQLDDVVLGSNHTWASRWSQRTGRTVDIGDVDFIEAGTWSMGCNTGRIGPGTVGWIARLGDGINPPLCGFIVCTSEPALYAEVDGAGNTIYECYVEEGPRRAVGARRRHHCRGLAEPPSAVGVEGVPAVPQRRDHHPRPDGCHPRRRPGVGAAHRRAPASRRHRAGAVVGLVLAAVGSRSPLARRRTVVTRGCCTLGPRRRARHRRRKADNDVTGDQLRTGAALPGGNSRLSRPRRRCEAHR